MQAGYAWKVMTRRATGLDWLTRSHEEGSFGEVEYQWHGYAEESVSPPECNPAITILFVPSCEPIKVILIRGDAR